MAQCIAFVTGYLGRKGLSNIPDVPIPRHSYFITDNALVAARARFKGWRVKYAGTDQFKKTEEDQYFKQHSIATMSARNQRIYASSLKSKKLKVFPQYYTDKKYDYTVWFDNKFNVNCTDTLKAIASYNARHAMMLHKHPASNTIVEEYTAAVKQPRYQVDALSYHHAIENYRKSVHSSGLPYFQTGFLIYNNHHPQLHQLINQWYQIILKLGINCQIGFELIKSDFKDCIAEFTYPIAKED